MQSLLFPEFSPSDLEQQALWDWTERWLSSFPAIDAGMGPPPGRSLALRQLKTPLGPMLAVAAVDGLVLLEFVDKDRIELQLAKATKVHDGPLMRCPRRGLEDGTLNDLDEVEDQVGAYFAGELTEFELRLIPTGTAFQQEVWKLLLRVPHGTQASYGDIADGLGKPSASRAVGAANGSNPIAIVQPCHRIVGADGTLTGYAGGLWRKRRLLELEAPATPAAPPAS